MQTTRLRRNSLIRVALTWRLLGFLGAFIPLVCGLGCAGGSGTEISGKVTHDGKPVTGGSLTFSPIAEGEEEPGQPAAADIGTDGTYKASSVTVGKCRIIYSPPQGNPEETKAKPSAYLGLQPKEAEVTIEAGKALDIELVRPGSK